MSVRSRIHDAMEAPKQMRQSVVVSIALSVLAILLSLVAMVVRNAD